jgi:hypothetical protein
MRYGNAKKFTYINEGTGLTRTQLIYPGDIIPTQIADAVNGKCMWFELPMPKIADATPRHKQKGVTYGTPEFDAIYGKP